MKKYLLLVCTLTILTTFVSCGKSSKGVTKESNLENVESTDTPDEELNDRAIGESITIEGVTVTVNSVIDSQTSTGEDAYEVNITYKNNSGKSLTIHPYDWHTVLQNGSTRAYVGGSSFSIDNVSKGEEWTGIVTLWKNDNTEKIKFESYALSLLQNDKKSATWIITSDEETNTNSESSELSENVTDVMSETIELEEVSESETESATITNSLEYDALQIAFMSLDFNSSMADVEKIIEENNFEFTKENYNGTPKNIRYKLAYDKDVARQKRASSGDSLDIEFSSEDGSFMYAKYTTYVSGFMNALLYNYGTYWDFRFETPQNEYSGYYYYESGDMSKDGIVFQYDNGNSHETAYYPCEDAEEALKNVLANAEK